MKEESLIMKKMGIHNGIFHADDVFCVALMQSIYEALEIIRIRDESLLATCDVVADVGNGKYDHHDVEKKKRENDIPYCAFGLLWEDFGLDYIRSQFPKLTDQKIQQEVAEKVALFFIQQIDAQDNGVDVMQSDVPVMTLCDIINSYVPIGVQEDEIEKAFYEAVVFGKMVLYKEAQKYVEHYENQRMIQAELAKQNVEESHILVLEKSVPWKEAVIELDPQEHVQYVVYQDVTGSWCTQVVPKEANSFAARKNLPVTWGGLRGEELSNITGVAECIFVTQPYLSVGIKPKKAHYV